MDILLKIRLHGDTPGLEEHRLSLDLFLGALAQLNVALRRSAATVVRKDQRDREYGSKGGRLPRDAEILSVQLAALEHGSATPVLALELAPDAPRQLPLALPLHAAEAFMESIELAQATDTRRPAPFRFVEKYLAALPRTVTRQEYELHVNGERRRRVVVDSRVEPDEEPAPPYLRRVRAVVAKVGWIPRAMVFLYSSGHQLGYDATETQVHDAIKLRDAGLDVDALVLDGGAPSRRLLWIRPADQPVLEPSPEERARQIGDRWDELLRRLAE